MSSGHQECISAPTNFGVPVPVMHGADCRADVRQDERHDVVSSACVVPCHSENNLSRIASNFAFCSLALSFAEDSALPQFPMLLLSQWVGFLDAVSPTPGKILLLVPRKGSLHRYRWDLFLDQVSGTIIGNGCKQGLFRTLTHHGTRSCPITLPLVEMRFLRHFLQSRQPQRTCGPSWRVIIAMYRVPSQL